MYEFRDGPADVHRVRAWLTNLRRPDRLADPAMRELLRAHGRLATGTTLEVGELGADLLREKIAALEPGDRASASERLPFLVLSTSFVEGAKNTQAARKLGLSERQLSRERTRAVSLLAEKLAPQRRPFALSDAPATEGLVDRPELVRVSQEVLEQGRRVHFYGPPGIGKTCLAAMLAARDRNECAWISIVPDVNSDLWGLLFELSESLVPDDRTLWAYLREPPVPGNLAVATRLALSSLSQHRRLVVIDGVDALRHDHKAMGFLDEVVRRLPTMEVVTIGRLRDAGRRSVRVPPLDSGEIAQFFARRGVELPHAPLVGHLTQGVPGVVVASAAFLARPGRVQAAALKELVGGHDHLVRAWTGIEVALRTAA